DQAQRLGIELDADEAVLLPASGLGRRVGRRDRAGGGQHQRDRMLGRRDRVAERRVHDNDALRRRGGNVDVVDADAGAPDNLQALRRGDDAGRDLGGRTYREALVITDDFEQLLGREAGLRVDLDAV